MFPYCKLWAIVMMARAGPEIWIRGRRSGVWKGAVAGMQFYHTFMPEFCLINDECLKNILLSENKGRTPSAPLGSAPK